MNNIKCTNINIATGDKYFIIVHNNLYWFSNLFLYYFIILIFVFILLIYVFLTK